MFATPKIEEADHARLPTINDHLRSSHNITLTQPLISTIEAAVRTKRHFSVGLQDSESRWQLAAALVTCYMLSVVVSGLSLMLKRQSGGIIVN